MARTKMLLITLCVVSLAVCLGGCGHKGQIRQDVAQYFVSVTTERIAALERDYTEYTMEANKRSQYEQRLAELQSCFNPATYSDLGWFSYYEGTGRYRYDDDLKYSAAQREIPVIETKLRYAKVCEQWAARLPPHISDLESLCTGWMAYNKGWKVWERQDGGYLVQGYGLGYIEEPCTGGWYYYTTGEVIFPADSSAQALLDKIEAYQDF
ncbi:MAG: hypothetical protein H8E40_10225 [Chloroflexi bacterium]|nr:hypothetical protein [Chloroflexota bacterium]